MGVRRCASASAQRRNTVSFASALALASSMQPSSATIITRLTQRRAEIDAVLRKAAVDGEMLASLRNAAPSGGESTDSQRRSGTLSREQIESAITDLDACTLALQEAAAISARFTANFDRESSIAELFRRRSAHRALVPAARRSTGHARAASARRSASGELALFGLSNVIQTPGRPRLNTPLFATPSSSKGRLFSDSGVHADEMPLHLAPPSSSSFALDMHVVKDELVRRVEVLEEAQRAWRATRAALEARANPKFQRTESAATLSGASHVLSGANGGGSSASSASAKRAAKKKRTESRRVQTLRIVRPIARTVTKAKRTLTRLRSAGSAGEMTGIPSGSRGSGSDAAPPPFELHRRLDDALEWGRDETNSAWEEADAEATAAALLVAGGESAAARDAGRAPLRNARIELEELALRPFLVDLLRECAVRSAVDDAHFATRSSALRERGMSALLRGLDIARLFQDEVARSHSVAPPVPPLLHNRSRVESSESGGTLDWKLNAVVIALAATELKNGLCRASALPEEKARACVQAVRTISKALTLSSRSANSSLSQAAVATRARARESMRREARARGAQHARTPTVANLAPIGTDELLPCMIVVVVEAGLVRPLSHLTLIEEWRDPNALMGEEGFCFATILTAVHYIISTNQLQRGGSDET